jgi:hypothetical protein
MPTTILSDQRECIRLHELMQAPSAPNPLVVLDAFWHHSHGGLLHIETIAGATEMSKDDVLSVFRRCHGVFRLSTLTEDMWECLLTPPRALGGTCAKATRSVTPVTPNRCTRLPSKRRIWVHNHY